MLCTLFTAAVWRYLRINKPSITLGMCLCPGLVDLGIRPNPQLPLLCNKQLGCNTKILIQSWSLFSSSRLEKSDFQTMVNAKLANVLAGKECCTFHAFSKLCSVSRRQLARMSDYWEFRIKTKLWHPQKKRKMEGEGKVENCNTLSSLKFNFHSLFQLELKSNNGLASLWGYFRC